MNTKLIFGCLAGSAVLHAVLAACSSNKAASADTSGPVEVATENCAKSFQIAGPTGPGGPMPPTTIYYAEHAYPGRTKYDLAGRVTNWNPIGQGDANLRPTGYDVEPQTVLYVKDGLVGAPCSGGPSGTTTFVYAP